MSPVAGMLSPFPPADLLSSIVRACVRQLLLVCGPVLSSRAQASCLRCVCLCRRECSTLLRCRSYSTQCGYINHRVTGNAQIFTHPLPITSPSVRSAGRLTVVLEQISNVPLSSAQLFVVVRLGSGEQRTRAAEVEYSDVRLLRSTVQFEIPRSCVQDRSMQLLVEVHDDRRGMRGSTGLLVWKIIRGDETHGSFPLWSAQNPAEPVYSEGQGSAITHVDMSVSFSAASRSLPMSASFTRSNVKPFTHNDFGVVRRASGGGGMETSWGFTSQSGHNASSLRPT